MNHPEGTHDRSQHSIPDGHDETDAALSQAIAQLLVATVWDLRQEANRAFAPLGLNTSQVYLLNLVANGNELRPSDLADRLSLTREGVSAMIHQFGEQGLLLSAPREDDRRARRLSLTEAGEALRREANDLWLAVVEARYTRVAHPDKEALLRILKIVHAA